MKEFWISVLNFLLLLLFIYVIYYLLKTFLFSRAKTTFSYVFFFSSSFIFDAIFKLLFQPQSISTLKATQDIQTQSLLA